MSKPLASTSFYSRKFICESSVESLVQEKHDVCDDVIWLNVVCLKNYATALEADLDTWTRGCDYDNRVYSDYHGSVLKEAYTGYPNHAREIGFLFSSTSYAYAVSKIRFFREIRS